MREKSQEGGGEERREVNDSNEGSSCKLLVLVKVTDEKGHQ